VGAGGVRRVAASSVFPEALQTSELETPQQQVLRFPLFPYFPLFVYFHIYILSVF
jgi:hypothetical protein